jgi:multidrug efflux system membrane fusion protein
VVPVAAIQRGAGGSFVFVVNPDKTVSQRLVTPGVQDGDRIAVVSGIKPGDTVVVDGADRLRDGADVEIPNPSRQAIAAPSAAAGDAARTARRAEAQAALNKSCGADIRKLCGDAAPGSRAARICLFQKRDSLSGDCSAALARLRGGRRGGGGAP